MTTALFRRLLRQHAGLLAATTLGLGLFEVFLIWVGAQIERSFGLAALAQQLLPVEMREAFISQFGFISFAGAVAFGFQHPFPMVAGIAFVVVVGTIPSAERESGLLDLILARSVTRTQYLLATISLLVLGAVALPAAMLAGAAGGLALVEVAGEIPWHRYAAPAGGMVTLLLAVSGYTLLIAAGSRRRGAAAARSAGLTLVFYVVDFLGSQWDWLAQVRLLSPFYYYKPVAAAVLPSTPIQNPLILAGIFLVSTLLAVRVFRLRDL